MLFMTVTETGGGIGAPIRKMLKLGRPGRNRRWCSWTSSTGDTRNQPRRRCPRRPSPRSWAILGGETRTHQPRVRCTTNTRDARDRVGARAGSNRTRTHDPRFGKRNAERVVAKAATARLRGTASTHALRGCPPSRPALTIRLYMMKIRCVAEMKTAAGSNRRLTRLRPVSFFLFLARQMSDPGVGPHWCAPVARVHRSAVHRTTVGFRPGGAHTHGKEISREAVERVVARGGDAFVALGRGGGNRAGGLAQRVREWIRGRASCAVHTTANLRHRRHRRHATHHRRHTTHHLRRASHHRRHTTHHLRRASHRAPHGPLLVASHRAPHGLLLVASHRAAHATRAPAGSRPSPPVNPDIAPIPEPIPPPPIVPFLTARAQARARGRPVQTNQARPPRPPRASSPSRLPPPRNPQTGPSLSKPPRRWSSRRKDRPSSTHRPSPA